MDSLSLKYDCTKFLYCRTYLKREEKARHHHLESLYNLRADLEGPLPFVSSLSSANCQKGNRDYLQVLYEKGS